MLELHLPDLSCSHCARAVTEAVRAIDPEARVDVDLDTKRVQLQSRAPREQLVQALADAGYNPD